MALRDLVVSHADLTEAQIEELIKPYLRYDPAVRQMVLLPPAADLGNRQRVIAYLIGLLGWPFVLPEDPPASSMTPAEMGAALNIPGGTLRPILKSLKDERLIQVSDGRYSVNHVTFPFLEQELSGTGGAPAAPPKKRTKPKSPQPQPPRTEPEPATAEEPQLELTEDGGPTDTGEGAKPPKPGSKPKGRSRRDATAAGAGPLERVRQLIKAGWFSQPRTVRDIVTELASRGATYRGQDLTRQMITLVRSEELRREKRTSKGSGRATWHYSEPNED